MTVPAVERRGIEHQLPIRLGDHASLLSQSEIGPAFSTFKNQLLRRVHGNVPDITQTASDRELIGLTSFYKDTPLLLTDSASGHLKTLLRHPHKEVRQNASQALGVDLSLPTENREGAGKKQYEAIFLHARKTGEHDQFAQMILGDLQDDSTLRGDRLEFEAELLPALLPYSSESLRQPTLNILKSLAKSHTDPERRKTAIKTLALLATLTKPDENTLLFDEGTRADIINHVIGSLQDTDTSVQEIAIASIAIHFPDQLTLSQKKKFLTNLQDVDSYEWYTQRILLTAVTAIETFTTTYSGSTEKPDVYALPGTFDPIHIGHVETAAVVSEATGAEVWILPNVEMRGKNPLSIDERLILIRKGIADNPNIYLPPVELLQDSDGWIDSKVDKLAKLAPFARQIGIARGSEVLERDSYNDPTDPKLQIPHIIVVRNNMPDVEGMLRDRGLDDWPVVRHNITLSSSDFKLAMSKGLIGEALSLLPPMTAQYLASQYTLGQTHYL